MAGIFKSYDIRMKGSEIEDKNIDRVSNAVITYFQNKGIEGIVIGGDARETSEIFRNSLLGKALYGGMNVILIKEDKNSACSTPLFNFTCSLYPENAGIMVTASHNPAEYNGLKLNDVGCKPIGYEDGLNESEKLYEKRVKISKNKKGKLTCVYPLNDLVKETCEQLNIGKNSWRKVKIAFDCATSVSTIDAKAFFDFLGADVKYINDWLDGSFPAHEPNPMVIENLRTLRSLVKSDKFVCGATGDGDYDRAGIVDEEGNPLYAHNIASLVVHELMQNIKEKEVHAIYTTTMGRSFRDAIENYGGKAHRVKVGRVHVINKGLDLMKENLRVIIGAEGSNHLMFPDKRKNFYENILLATGSVISYCLRNNIELSKAVKKTDKYYFLGEQNYEISRKDTSNLKNCLEKEYPKILKGELSREDGILVENENSWFSIRDSNTEPLIRLNVESVSKQKMQKIVNSLEEIIISFNGKKR